MADHGKNKRRSYFARNRQARGKIKAATDKKERTEHRRKLAEYWKEE